MTNNVASFWNAIIKTWPTPQPTYEQLNPMEQMMLVQAINIVLQILSNHEQ